MVITMAVSNKSWRIVGKTLKYIGIAVVVFVFVVLFWRFLSGGDPKEVTTLAVNEKTYAAYEAEGDDMVMYYQKQLDMTRADNNSGYFGVTQVTIIPAANQIQVVFRYNNSTLRYVAEDKELDEVPGRDEDIFDVSIVINTDLTPENDEDNLYGDNVNSQAVSETRYYPTSVISAKKNVYNYRKYIFDGITIDNDLTLAAFFDIYFKGDVNAEGNVDYTADPYGTLCLYTYLDNNISKRLNLNDIDALVDWKKKSDAEGSR